MKDLLKAVCSRLTGHGGEIGSIIRLHTQYGGGKTHGLIALVHAARGMKGVPNPGDFVDPELIPSVPVRVAALDGENSDPTNGLTLEGNLRAYSIWGELAYRLAGAGGYERVLSEANPAPTKTVGGDGVCWLQNTVDGRQMVIQTEDGPQAVKSLNQLVETLKRVGAPGEAPSKDAELIV